MKNLSIANDIVPVAEFKAGISRWLKTLQGSGHPLVITQNGKPAGVLLSPADYDELTYHKSFLDSVAQGLEDAESGRTYRTGEVKAALSARRT